MVTTGLYPYLPEESVVVEATCVPFTFMVTVVPADAWLPPTVTVP
jgi:hypothetical protein